MANIPETAYDPRQPGADFAPSSFYNADIEAIRALMGDRANPGFVDPISRKTIFAGGAEGAGLPQGGARDLPQGNVLAEIMARAPGFGAGPDLGQGFTSDGRAVDLAANLTQLEREQLNSFLRPPSHWLDDAIDIGGNLARIVGLLSNIYGAAGYMGGSLLGQHFGGQQGEQLGGLVGGLAGGLAGGLSGSAGGGLAAAGGDAASTAASSAGSTAADISTTDIGGIGAGFGAGSGAADTASLLPGVQSGLTSGGFTAATGTIGGGPGSAGGGISAPGGGGGAGMGGAPGDVAGGTISGGASGSATTPGSASIGTGAEAPGANIIHGAGTAANLFGTGSTLASLINQPQAPGASPPSSSLSAPSPTPAVAPIGGGTPVSQIVGGGPSSGPSSSGLSPASLQSLIDAFTHSRDEQIRSQFAGMGLSGSSMEQQAVSEFDTGARKLGRELTSGQIDQSQFEALLQGFG